MDLRYMGSLNPQAQYISPVEGGEQHHQLEEMSFRKHCFCSLLGVFRVSCVWKFLPLSEKFYFHYHLLLLMSAAIKLSQEE